MNLSDLLKQSFDCLMSSVHTAIPGTIESYDYKKKQAKVKPLIKQEFEGGEKLDYPVIANVPVIFPGSSDFILHYPLKKGDGVLLIFSERSLENWLSSRGTAETGDGRKFSLSDAIAIPGLFSFNNTGKVASGNKLEMLYKDAKIEIDDSGTITLNGNLEVLK